MAGNWTCPDDGKGPTIASNTGSGNESYKFTTENGYNTALKIEVFDLASDAVIATVELVTGTTPTVTIGKGQGIRIKDEADSDGLQGKGTYTKV